MLFASRNNKATADATAPVANVDHWHTAYGIYICDTFLDPLQVQTDPDGIHSHADGVIHIHPYLSQLRRQERDAAGLRGCNGLKLSDTKIDVPGVGLVQERRRLQRQDGDVAGRGAGTTEARDDADDRHARTSARSTSTTTAC